MMKANRQIGLAVGGSVIGHLLVAGGATAILAFQRAAPPANDNFAAASALHGEPVAGVFGDNLYATREHGEPAHVGTLTGGSVWWRWEAKESCAVEVQVDAEDFDEVVVVYRGAVLETLTEVTGRREGERTPLAFQAEVGTTYYIAVAGARVGEIGAFDLSLFADVAREELTEPENELVLLLPEMFEIAEEEEEVKPESLQYLRTTQNDREKNAPDRARFESDRNTTAAGDSPPTEGAEDVPSIAGEEVPFLELDDRDYVDGKIGEDAALPVMAEWAPAELPSPAETTDAERRETETERAEPTEPTEVMETLPEVTPLEALAETEVPDDLRGEDPVEEATAPEIPEVESSVEELATMEDAPFAASEIAEETVDAPEPEDVPPPEPLPPAETEQRPLVAETAKPPEPEEEAAPKAVAATPSPGRPEGETGTFQPHTRKKRTVGKLSNLGAKPALDVAETPFGHYKRKVDQAIQKSWHMARSSHGDFASYGSLKVRFWINRNGRVDMVKILKKNANAVMVDFSILGIKAAKIPPVPDELMELTQDGRLEFDYDIIIY